MSEDDDILEIVKARIAVGFLGEKDQANWWPSYWLASNSEAFLSPVYGERTDAARYHGLVEAARKVHDSRIGVGRAFHLFRLPENLERRLHEAVIGGEAADIVSVIRTKDDAEAALFDRGGILDTRPGPIRIGEISDLEDSGWLKIIAGHYLSAFQSAQQSFPYFAEGV